MTEENNSSYQNQVPEDVIRPSQLVVHEASPYLLSELEFYKIKDTRSFWSSYAEKFFFLFLGLVAPASIALYDYYKTGTLSPYPGMAILVSTALFLFLFFLFGLISRYCKTQRSRVIKQIETFFESNRPTPIVKQKQ